MQEIYINGLNTETEILEEFTQCSKGSLQVSAASFKKQNHWTFMALSKFDGSVIYACCQCATGKVRTCYHMFAVMKLVAKLAIGKLIKIPETNVCTQNFALGQSYRVEGNHLNHQFQKSH